MQFVLSTPESEKARTNAVEIVSQVFMDTVADVRLRDTVVSWRLVASQPRELVQPLWDELR
jgi:hypothetical protein